MLIRNLIATTAVVLTLLGEAGAQSNTLRGKVRSITGAVVNNAIVELRIGGGGMISQTVTRNDGDFAFSNLSSGEYEVAVTVAGYEPTVQLARFTGAGRMNFSEVINIEVLVRPLSGMVLAPPGTNFVQEIPKAARAAHDRGVARLREGKSEEGVALLREAIARFSDYFDAHFALGRELFRMGKNREALEEFERARQINEREDAVYFMFGMVMLKEQKFAVAQRAFREAVNLDGTNAASRFYRAQVLIELALREKDDVQRGTDLTDAEAELNRAWELSKKRLTSVHLQRARIYEQRGDKESAARELEAFLRAEPEARNANAVRTAITRLRTLNKPESQSAKPKTPQ